MRVGYVWHIRVNWLLTISTFSVRGFCANSGILISTVLFLLPLLIILDICWYHSIALVFVNVLAFNSLYLCFAFFISIFIVFASWSLITCLPLWCAFCL